jgi:arsenical pump membrane protein
LPSWGALALSLLALSSTLAAAVLRPRWLPETVVAVGFALLLLALTFVASALVTALMGLDATVVLLTPVVFVTAARLRAAPTPHAYACTHLANSASLLLVVSNLTNLLAFHASRLSFTRFAALMALPWTAAIAIEWVALRWFFARQLEAPAEPAELPRAAAEDIRRAPRLALGVLAATLVGFVLSSPLGVAPVWFAVAGAAAITLPALIRRPRTLPRELSYDQPNRQSSRTRLIPGGHARRSPGWAC